MYRLVFGLAAVIAAVLVSRIVRGAVARLEQERPSGENELARLRTRETALVIVATAIPYVTAFVVAIVILGWFLPNSATALGGSAFLAVLVGFALQRFLMDIVAGSLMAFERWYGVGDFVRLEPTGVAGIVEQFGLRTSVVRALNGDLTYVPNSQIIAATRRPGNARTYSIELLTSDVERAAAAIETVAERLPLGEARFLRAPWVVEQKELAHDTWLVRGRAVVPPTMEWLAEQLLVSTLKAQLADDALLAEPIVYTLDVTALSRYQRRVLVA